MPDKEVKKLSAGVIPAADSERGSAPEANIPCTSGKENIKNLPYSDSFTAPIRFEGRWMLFAPAPWL